MPLFKSNNCNRFESVKFEIKLNLTFHKLYPNEFRKNHDSFNILVGDRLMHKIIFDEILAEKIIES